MGFKYTLPIASTALSTTNSLITVIAGATRSLKINEIYLSGQGVASANNDIGVYRVGTAGVTGTVAITPAPLNPAAPAAAFTNFTVWVTQPVVGTKILDLGVNANGATGYYRPMAGSEIEIPAGANAAASFTIRSVSGTSNVTGWVTVEEI